MGIGIALIIDGSMLSIFIKRILRNYEKYKKLTELGQLTNAGLAKSGIDAEITGIVFITTVLLFVAACLIRYLRIDIREYRIIKSEDNNIIVYQNKVKFIDIFDNGKFELRYETKDTIEEKYFNKVKYRIEIEDNGSYSKLSAHSYSRNSKTADFSSNADQNLNDKEKSFLELAQSKNRQYYLKAGDGIISKILGEVCIDGPKNTQTSV